ncbi:MAG: glycosyltransferase family 4 protein [Patescibacteria group bacterium]|jgi:phosphatidylinositol alpha-1,6-mannosyltransferase
MTEPRVTLITVDYPPARGGVARYLYELVKASNGAIRVVVPEHHPAADLEGVDSVRMVGSVWPKWWPMIGVSRREGKRAKVLLVSHVFPVGTAAWISKIFGGPEYVVVLHGLDVRMAHGAWKLWLLGRVCRAAKTVVVNSESTRRDILARVAGLSTVVLTPGVEDVSYPTREEARGRLGIDRDTELVVSVARLVPRKGIDFSLRAISRLQSTRTVMYVVVGDGSDAERLEEVAREARTRVTWVRNADEEEKRCWLAAADIFLLPVREDETDVEGFGIVYLEAALAGIPAIAGRSGGAGEAVTHEKTGLLINPNRIDEMSVAITRLLDNEEERAQMGSAAKERALRDFQWEERWGKLAQILNIQP